MSLLLPNVFVWPVMTFPWRLLQVYSTAAGANLAPESYGENPPPDFSPTTSVLKFPCEATKWCSCFPSQSVVSAADSGPGSAAEETGSDQLLHVSSELGCPEHPAVLATQHQKHPSNTNKLLLSVSMSLSSNVFTRIISRPCVWVTEWEKVRGRGVTRGVRGNIWLVQTIPMGHTVIFGGH